MSRILRSFLANESALKRFLSRYKKRPQDVDDMAQETFLRAFDAEQKREIQSPRAFLFRIAKNVALNSLSNKAGQIVDYVGNSSDTDVLSSERPDIAEHRLDARQRLEILEQALATLPPKCRRVFLLRKVDGYTHKEIAARLGISTKTVENHLTNGALKCSQYLRGRGFDPVKFVTSIALGQDADEDTDGDAEAGGRTDDGRT